MKNGLSDGLTAVLAILGLVLSLGTKFLFTACGAGDDGTYMSCHWAQNAVITVGVVLVVLFAAGLFIRDLKVRAGLIFAGLPVTVSAMLLASGYIIRLCAFNEMRCRAVMKNAVLIIGCVMFVTGMIDLVITLRKSKNHGISR